MTSDKLISGKWRFQNEGLVGGRGRERERERESRDGSGADGVEGRIRGKDRALKTLRLIERLAQELISWYVLPTHLPPTTQAPRWLNQAFQASLIAQAHRV